MDLTAKIVRRNFSVAGGELAVGGLAVSAMAEQFGTPLFIYDRGLLQRKWDLLRATLPAEFAIHYSVKANPTRAILEFFLAQGAGLEVASAGEFRQALNAGCPPHKIIFAGPGKTEVELQSVIAEGIGEIHVESIREAQRIAHISQTLGMRSAIAIRVNPGGEAQGGAMRMGGKPAPFGVDEEQLDEVLDFIFSEPALEMRGIHLFAGTQILDYNVLLAQYSKGIEIARRVASRMGGPLHTLDFGGGLGIPYFAGDDELDMAALREGLRSLMNEVRGDKKLAGTQFIVEPGRFLVGESGIYVMRITDIKVSRGKKFYICDGGMHHHLAASGNLGQTIKRNFPLVMLNRIDSAALQTETVDIVGPLCTPLDVLGRGALLPSAEVGDLVGVLQSGAYGRSASPSAFLSHPTPAEVLVENGQASPILQRGDLSDYDRNLCSPPKMLAHSTGKV